mgnify:CR=1 FL=1
MSEYLISRDDGGGLSHYGITGQKWGVRRFENEDGTLTEAGKIRYNYRLSDRSSDRRQYNRDAKKLEKLANDADRQGQMRIAERQAAKAKKNLVKGIVTGGAAVGGYLGMANFMNGKSYLEKQTMYNDKDMMSINRLGEYSVLGLGALGAVHLGKSVYHGVKASIAKKKASDLGHDKAVMKYQMQVDKMLGRFAGTPYEERIQKQIERYNVE